MGVAEGFAAVVLTSIGLLLLVGLLLLLLLVMRETSRREVGKKGPYRPEKGALVTCTTLERFGE